MLRDQILALQTEIQSLVEDHARRLEHMVKDLDQAAKNWPDHQRVSLEDEVWFGRDCPTPEGSQVWASDGVGVWLIHGDGKPIPDYATRVLYWTPALIPLPPKTITNHGPKSLPTPTPDWDEFE